MEVKAKKSLGQNFLISETIIDKIVAEVSDLEESLVIEIGPGMGALTRKLVNKASYVLAYEIDKECITYLNKTLKNNNLKIINKDILKANLKEDIATYNYKNLYIIGNLPYYITTPIMLKLIEENLAVNKYIFMVQDEVANRYTALKNNKEYNALTVYLNYLFVTKKCFQVPNTCFNPIPNVTSAVISLTPNPHKPLVLNEQFFYQINQAIFRQKRKTLTNNLKDILNKVEMEEVFKNLGFKSSIRAEELSICDIIKLSEEIFKLKNCYEMAKAKINLTLRVKEEKDGFHEISSLMVPLELADTLVFVKSAKDEVISNVNILDNACLKALKLFKQVYNIKENVTIYLKKEIPIAAGLAGGSSDASATIRGLNRLFNLNKDLKELEDIANRLGSDNAFCLYSKPAKCSGRGEILNFIPKFNNKEVLLIKPQFGLSTKEIYQNYHYIKREDLTDKCIAALINNEDFKDYLFNDLETPALLNNDYANFVKHLEELKVTSYQSGSGPTRFSFEVDKYDMLKEKTKYLIIKTKIIF